MLNNYRHWLYLYDIKDLIQWGGLVFATALAFWEAKTRRLISMSPVRTTEAT